MLAMLIAPVSTRPPATRTSFAFASLTTNTSRMVSLSLVNKKPHGTIVRLTITEVHDALLTLAGFVEADPEE